MKDMTTSELIEEIASRPRTGRQSSPSGGQQQPAPDAEHSPRDRSLPTGRGSGRRAGPRPAMACWRHAGR